jgi:uncharacterized membrane protein
MATSAFGPVELVAIGFPQAKVPVPVQTAIARAIASEVVRLLDLVVLRRSTDGELIVVEVEDLGDEIEITGLDLPGSGLTGDDDIASIGEGIPPGTSAVVLVVEHSWARELVGAARDAGAVVLASERIPAEVVNEVADLASAG